MKISTASIAIASLGLIAVAPAVASDRSTAATVGAAVAIFQNDTNAANAAVDAHDSARLQLVGRRMASHSILISRRWSRGAAPSCLRRAISPHMGTFVWSFGAAGIQLERGNYAKAGSLLHTSAKSEQAMSRVLRSFDPRSC